jgi:hypothetical protein
MRVPMTTKGRSAAGARHRRRGPISAPPTLRASYDTTMERRACPVCGAASGQPCVSMKGAASGMRLTSLAHAGRLRSDR